MCKQRKLPLLVRFFKNYTYNVKGRFDNIEKSIEQPTRDQNIVSIHCFMRNRNGSTQCVVVGQHESSRGVPIT